MVDYFFANHERLNIYCLVEGFSLIHHIEHNNGNMIHSK